MAVKEILKLTQLIPEQKTIDMEFDSVKALHKWINETYPGNNHKSVLDYTCRNTRKINVYITGTLFASGYIRRVYVEDAPKLSSHNITKRELDIFVAHRNGKTFVELSKEYQITTERIRQLYEKVCRFIRDASAAIKQQQNKKSN